MNASASRQVYTFVIPTPDGDFLAHFSDRGLCGLSFPSRAGRRRAGSGSPRTPRAISRWLAVTAKALSASLLGRDPRVLPPIDLETGTAFQQQVWGVLRRIKSGRTMSYAEVARAVGRPRAARAVGGACGANPVPVLVPCHRVLAAHQGLGGFSGGLNWKRLLLQREGAWSAVGQSS